VSGLSRPQVRPEDLGLGALFRLTDDAVIVVDLATDRVALVNRAAERLLGYTSQQAAHLPIERLVPLSERPGMHARVHGLLHRPSAAGTECRMAEARRHEQARVEGMLRTIETLGRALDQELALAKADLHRVVADRHVPGGVRVLAERGRQGVVRALGLLHQLRRVGQVEAMELMPGAEDLFAPVTLAPATNYDGDEGGKPVSGQPTQARAQPARVGERRHHPGCPRTNTRRCAGTSGTAARLESALVAALRWHQVMAVRVDG
jgi:PAS domain S-box-containing protein